MEPTSIREEADGGEREGDEERREGRGRTEALFNIVAIWSVLS